MTLFSQRKGLSPIRAALQSEGMDQPLRNGIWNVLSDHYWSHLSRIASAVGSDIFGDWQGFLVSQIWADYFKIPTDTIPNHWTEVHEQIRDYFYKCTWFEVYDFVEFLANASPDDGRTSPFLRECNLILEREMSAYRFVGRTIVQLTSEQEISEIEKALAVPSSLSPVKAHLQSALEKLADRTTPDYRNSIKESISAVESLCNIIKGAKTTLGDTLKEFKELHPALRESFIKLYGYTNDAQGIRHALLKEPNLVFEDAKFMLVPCSAFINYLTSLASRQGVKI